MSITNTVIRTNRITAGTANVTTLNTSTLSVRSGSITLNSLNSNTIASNNLTVTGTLTAPALTSLVTEISNNALDISINQFRIEDLSGRIADTNVLLITLSNDLYDLIIDLENTDVDEFVDISQRVTTNARDISDLSGRIDNIVIGSGLVTRVEFSALSGEVTTNTQEIIGISNDIDVLRTGFVTLDRFDDLSNQVQLNTANITDLCDGVATLIASGGVDPSSVFVTNDQILDLSNRIYTNTLTIAGLSDEISTQIASIGDLSGRVASVETDILGISQNVFNNTETLEDISSKLTLLEASYTVDGDGDIGFRVDPDSQNFRVHYTLSNGTIGVSQEANMIIGLSSDTILVQGNTEFRGQVTFNDITSIPANTRLVDTSGVTNIDFLSTTPYSHTDYIMFDTSEMRALQYYGETINPHSSELHLRFSRLSKSRNVIVSVSPATVKRLVLELYDDDDLSDSTIIRQEGNILVQPGAVPVGYTASGYTGTITSGNAENTQDYSTDPYRYLYEDHGFVTVDRVNTGRFFYSQAVVIPIDDVSQYISTAHPNYTGNRMDISFYGDISSSTLISSSLDLGERYHRYYQTGSYQFHIEFVSPGIPQYRNRSHIFLREISRTRPLRYAQTTDDNILLSNSNKEQLQLILARLLFLNQTDFATFAGGIDTMFNAFYTGNGFFVNILP
jgi:hypothetical protein